MIKTILFVGAFLVLEVHESHGNNSLESCSLSCDDNEDQAIELIKTRAGLPGIQGKRGGMGQKGERGIKGNTGSKGQTGPQGIPGSACDGSPCDDIAAQMATLKQQLNDQLATEMATLKQDQSALKERIRMVSEGWLVASNNHLYKLFNHEIVNYKTAKTRCAVIGARLTAAGLRTPKLRSEIKRLLPSSVSYIWIGLDDLVRQGNYVWADEVESTSSDTDWYSGQPSASYERCVAMGSGSYNGRLHDRPCTDNYHYLCEL